MQTPSFVKSLIQAFKPFYKTVNVIGIGQIGQDYIDVISNHYYKNEDDNDRYSVKYCIDFKELALEAVERGIEKGNSADDLKITFDKFGIGKVAALESTRESCKLSLKKAYQELTLVVFGIGDSSEHVLAQTCIRNMVDKNKTVKTICVSPYARNKYVSAISEELLMSELLEFDVEVFLLDKGRMNFKNEHLPIHKVFARYNDKVIRIINSMV